MDDQDEYEDPEDHADEMYSVQGYCTGSCERCDDRSEEGHAARTRRGAAARQVTVHIHPPMAMMEVAAWRAHVDEARARSAELAVRRGHLRRG